MNQLIEYAYPFSIPEGSTLDLAARPLYGKRMSDKCQQLIEKGGSEEIPESTGITIGRFYEVDQPYRLDEVPRIVEGLKIDLGYRSLRPGFSKEALLCVDQNTGIPPNQWFIVPSKRYGDRMVCRIEGCFMVLEDVNATVFGINHAIFLVEEQ